MMLTIVNVTPYKRPLLRLHETNTISIYSRARYVCVLNNNSTTVETGALATVALEGKT